MMISRGLFTPAAMRQRNEELGVAGGSEKTRPGSHHLPEQLLAPSMCTNTPNADKISVAQRPTSLLGLRRGLQAAANTVLLGSTPIAGRRRGGVGSGFGISDRMRREQRCTRWFQDSRIDKAAARPSSLPAGSLLGFGGGAA